MLFVDVVEGPRVIDERQILGVVDEGDSRVGW